MNRNKIYVSARSLLFLITGLENEKDRAFPHASSNSTPKERKEQVNTKGKSGLLQLDKSW